MVASTWQQLQWWPLCWNIWPLSLCSAPLPPLSTFQLNCFCPPPPYLFHWPHNIVWSEPFKSPDRRITLAHWFYPWLSIMGTIHTQHEALAAIPNLMWWTAGMLKGSKSSVFIFNISVNAAHCVHFTISTHQNNSINTNTNINLSIMVTNHAEHESLALTLNLNITACTCKFLSTKFDTERVKLKETEFCSRTFS